jgi:hypothetical protein
METISDDSDQKVLNTTLGDLIHAISEAAEEAQIEQEDLAPITLRVLEQLLGRQDNSA